MRDFPPSHQRREPVRMKAFQARQTNIQNRETKLYPLAPPKYFVVNRSATNVENSIYPPPRNHVKAEHHNGFELAPPRTKGFFSRKTTLVGTRTKGYHTRRKEQHATHTLDRDVDPLYIFTLAVFPDGSNPSRETQEFQQNATAGKSKDPNPVGMGHLFHSENTHRRDFP